MTTKLYFPPDEWLWLTGLFADMVFVGLATLGFWVWACLALVCYHSYRAMEWRSRYANK